MRFYICFSNLQHQDCVLAHGNHACDLFQAGFELSHPKLFEVASMRKQSKSLTPTNSTLLLTTCCLAQKSFLALMLISLSNDVSSNPGPMAGFARSQGLKVAHLNIRSIPGKIDDVQLLLKEKPFDILTISKSWLKAHIADHEISISGYSFVRNDLKGDQHGGGSLTYIKDGIPYRTRTDLLTTEMESCLIELALTANACSFLQYIDPRTKYWIVLLVLLTGLYQRCQHMQKFYYSVTLLLTTLQRNLILLIS